MNAHTLIKQKNSDGEVTEQATPHLHMTTNAEEKRHIIGDKFIELAEEIMENLKNKSNRPVYLAQGMTASVYNACNDVTSIIRTL